MAGMVARGSGGKRLTARAALYVTPRGLVARAVMLALLVLSALVTLVVAFQVPYHTTIAVGDTGAERRVTGFHNGEGTGAFTYRWTTDRATVRLPLGVYPGEADIVLSGDRPGGVPPAVTLAVDQARPAQVVSTRTFVPYAVPLPTNAGAWSLTGTPALTITPADTVTPPRDNRALGVAVQRVVVFTNPLRFGPVAPPLLAILLVCGMALTLALVALSLSPPVGWYFIAAYGPTALAAVYLALRRADDPGEQARAVAGFAVAALVALLLTQRDAITERPWARGLARGDGRWLVLVAMLLAAGYAVYASQALFGRLYDDAYITLRYARNFAAGQGLVYNPGEPPVEGYTNFSLTVLLAGAAKLGLPLVATARAVSSLAAVAVVAATYRLTSRVLPEAPGIVRAVPSLVLAACGWFAFFGAIGLETHLFALCVVLAASLIIERRLAWASVAFAAAYLTRPEGAGLWGVTLLWLLGTGLASASLHEGHERQHGKGHYLLQDAARFTAPFALIAGAHEAFRLAYYGEPVPNTFYDKVGTTTAQLRRGIDYLLHILPTLHPLALTVLIAVAACIPSRLVVRPAARYLAVLAAAFVAYIALVGGDFIGPRFLMHIFPVFVVLAVAGIVTLVDLLSQRMPSAVHPAHGTGIASFFSAALIVLWFFLPLTPPGTFTPERTHMRLVTGLTALGQYLKATAPPGATLAIEVAGVVPFESGLPTIDMLGLNDTHIAHTIVATGEARAGHEKQDPDYVLARRPLYIAVGMTSRGRPGRGLDRPGFDEQYARVALVRMNASVVSPALVLPLTPEVDVDAAMRQGYTYALYQRRAG